MKKKKKRQPKRQPNHQRIDCYGIETKSKVGKITFTEMRDLGDLGKPDGV